MNLALFCLDGNPAPDNVASDLRSLARLPEAARLRFWDALGPALAEPLPESAERSLDAFARAFEVSAEELGRALKAARFLVREAGARALDREHFEKDLVTLCGGPLSLDSVIIVPILLSQYDSARKVLAFAASRATISDHGFVLQSIEWRIDAVIASSRGETANAQVALMTLGYRQGARDERVTLQLSREKLEELRVACERMLRASGPKTD